MPREGTPEGWAVFWSWRRTFARGMGRILELETDLRQIEGLRHYVLTGTETTLPDSVNDEVKEQITNRLRRR